MEDLNHLKRASYRLLLVTIVLAVVLNLIVLGGPVAASPGFRTGLNSGAGSLCLSYGLLDDPSEGDLK